MIYFVIFRPGNISSLCYLSLQRPTVIMFVFCRYCILVRVCLKNVSATEIGKLWKDLMTSRTALTDCKTIGKKIFLLESRGLKHSKFFKVCLGGELCLHYNTTLILNSFWKDSNAIKPQTKFPSDIFGWRFCLLFCYIRTPWDEITPAYCTNLKSRAEQNLMHFVHIDN